VSGLVQFSGFLGLILGGISVRRSSSYSILGTLSACDGIRLVGWKAWTRSGLEEWHDGRYYWIRERAVEALICVPVAWWHSSRAGGIG
jgi:hypothetical protein